MMTLLVRRQLQDGRKSSSFHRFEGLIEETEGDHVVHLVVHGVEGSSVALELDLQEDDVALVVSGRETVSTYRWRDPRWSNRKSKSAAS